MAEGRQDTPEKQLLKLIEDPNAAGGSAIQQARLKHKGLGMLSLSSLRGALFGRFSFLKRTGQKKAGSLRLSFSFSAVNKLLLGAIILFFIYVAGDTLASSVNLMHPPNFAFQKEKTAAGEPQSIGTLKEVSYYLQKVAVRDIFKEFRPQAANEKREVLPPDSNEKIKNLTLVGISWSSSPDVIIEDKAQQRTFFLKQGQSVGAGAKVEAIYKDRVIVSLEGKEFELR